MHGSKIGHAKYVWDVRQNAKVTEAFGNIWNSKPEDMLTSFDGTAIHLPPEQTGEGFHTHMNWHVDQSFVESKFLCV